MQIRTASIRLLWLAGLIPGCLNADPSYFPPVTVPEAGPKDVAAKDVDLGEVDPDVPHVLTCGECFQAPDTPGPGCGTQWATCAASKQCVAIVNCGLDNGCYAFSTAGEVLTCVIPCFTSNGVASTSDPVVAIAGPFSGCALGGPCQPACVGTP